MARFFPTVSLLLLLAFPAFAEPSLGAELRVQVDVLYPVEEVDHPQSARIEGATSSSIRLKSEGQNGNWSYDLNYLIQGSYGGGLGVIQPLSAPTDNSALLPLGNLLIEDGDSQLFHRFDRLWVAHTTPQTVVRIGRQAVTWGHGEVFRPLDLFNPVPPGATDTSYKPGIDMLYGQYLFESGADLQLLVIPRRKENSGLDLGESSFALKGLTSVGGVEAELVLAQDRRDKVLAAGFAGPVGDAIWKADVVTTFQDRGGTKISGVVSLHHSWTWNERPVTGFVEYHHNGFGVSDQRSVEELPSDLTDRLARGQAFNTGRDYLALGSSLQWTPLLQISPTLITNLNDGSMLGLTTVTYSLSEDANLVSGVQAPLGPRGTEFGGLARDRTGSQYQPAPVYVFFRLEKFF